MVVKVPSDLLCDRKQFGITLRCDLCFRIIHAFSSDFHEEYSQPLQTEKRKFLLGDVQCVTDVILESADLESILPIKVGLELFEDKNETHSFFLLSVEGILV